MRVTVSELTIVLKVKEQELHEKFFVKSLAVFGSVARGEAKENSDIDFVVEFDRPVGMVGFLKLKHFLEDLLHTEVDLATAGALHPHMKDSILKEAIRVA
jgi:predicted nucleotidyltransferase